MDVQFAVDVPVLEWLLHEECDNLREGEMIYHTKLKESFKIKAIDYTGINDTVVISVTDTVNFYVRKDVYSYLCLLPSDSETGNVVSCPTGFTGSRVLLTYTLISEGRGIWSPVSSVTSAKQLMSLDVFIPNDMVLYDAKFKKMYTLRYGSSGAKHIDSSSGELLHNDSKQLMMHLYKGAGGYNAEQVHFPLGLDFGRYYIFHENIITKGHDFYVNGEKYIVENYFGNDLIQARTESTRRMVVIPFMSVFRPEYAIA